MAEFQIENSFFCEKIAHRGDPSGKNAKNVRNPLD